MLRHAGVPTAAIIKVPVKEKVRYLFVAVIIQRLHNACNIIFKDRRKLGIGHRAVEANNVSLGVM